MVFYGKVLSRGAVLALPWKGLESIVAVALCPHLSGLMEWRKRAIAARILQAMGTHSSQLKGGATVKLP